MRCPNCQSENPENARFCIECGAAFERRCLKCGFDNLPQAKFCSQCGSSFTEATAPPTHGEVRRWNVGQVDGQIGRACRSDGERRHLTVLFCDLVGSTAIAAQLDPEEWRETVAGYHRAAAEAITRFDGHVAKYLGDGVMAYFGWPAAHDNDAERAARAGLAILDAIAKLNEQPGHAKLSARVGIDSGAVVVGAGAGQRGRCLRRRAQYRRARAGSRPSRARSRSPTPRIGWSRDCSWSRISARRRSRVSNGRSSSIG